MNRGERYRTMPYLDANGLLAWGFEKKGATHCEAP